MSQSILDINTGLSSITPKAEFNGLDDGERNTTFESGGSVSFTFFGTSMSGGYAGRVIIDGELMPVFEDMISSGIYFVFSSRATPNWPNNFASATLMPPADTTDFPICFAAGTLIATPAGEIRVEHLIISDDVFTADGRTVS